MNSNIVTAGTMDSQKGTVESIVKSKGDYVLASRGIKNIFIRK